MAISLPWPLPTAAWINRPQIQTTTKEVRRPGEPNSQRNLSQRC